VIGFHDFKTLRAIPRVMAVAGGVKKAPAILAVLRGGYIDTLVTDKVTANTVLNLYKKNRDSHVAVKSEVLING
jgi:DNA-binding transcriptional regulator LsrR (DeoR family)